MLVLVVLVSATAAAATVGFLLVRHWPQADPALSATASIGRRLEERPTARRLLRSRMDPATATGLALTVALAGIVLAGAVVGTLAWMIRRDVGFVSVDGAVERWAESHATAFSDGVLEAITRLGDTVTIVVIGVVIAAYGLWRWRKPAVLVFVLSVVAGQMLISNTIKFLIDRARPELRPRADFTGASFPSGHTTAATATYLAVALVLAIGSSPKTRAALVSTAVAIGVAVGCTRALLGVHWFSDVLAGLAIGWAWFGLCAVAVGGRLLRFGAPAMAALSPTAHGPPLQSTATTGKR